MKLTKKQFKAWVDRVGAHNCNDVIYRIKKVYAKAIALNEYTLDSKLAKTKEAEALFDLLSQDKQSDIGVMMMEIIAQEQAKLAI